MPDREEIAHLPALPTLLRGQPFGPLPRQLLIPPDALQLVLDEFTGPFDLLLYLVRRHRIDVVALPLTQIVHQYMSYLDMMQQWRFEVASGYMVMAATLAAIKSALLLPSTEDDTVAEPIGEMELMRRLELYERFQKASLMLEQRPRLERDVLSVSVLCDDYAPPSDIAPLPSDIAPVIWGRVMKSLLGKKRLLDPHHIKKATWSVKAHMAHMLRLMHASEGAAVDLSHFTTAAQGRMGIVVSMLATLELARRGSVSIEQKSDYSTVFVHLRSQEI